MISNKIFQNLTVVQMVVEGYNLINYQGLKENRGKKKVICTNVDRKEKEKL